MNFLANPIASSKKQKTSKEITDLNSVVNQLDQIDVIEYSTQQQNKQPKEQVPM